MTFKMSTQQQQRTNKAKRLIENTPINRLRATVIICKTFNGDAVEGYLYSIYATPEDKQADNPHYLIFTMSDSNGEITEYCNKHSAGYDDDPKDKAVADFITARGGELCGYVWGDRHSIPWALYASETNEYKLFDLFD